MTTTEANDERLDRVLVRNSSNVVLTVTDWYLPTEFVDSVTMEDLSDHKPLAVDISWEQY